MAVNMESLFDPGQGSRTLGNFERKLYENDVRVMFGDTFAAKCHPRDDDVGCNLRHILPSVPEEYHALMTALSGMVFSPRIWLQVFNSLFKGLPILSKGLVHMYKCAYYTLCDGSAPTGEELAEGLKFMIQRFNIQVCEDQKELRKHTYGATFTKSVVTKIVRDFDPTFDCEVSEPSGTKGYQVLLN